MENTASRFGQRLAHTEKKFRDRALKKLTQYLTRRTEWSALEWDKLWKALFYCMWMSDKRPVQEELSTSLSQLVHQIPTPETALTFVHSFFRTMHREWHGIDGLRLDKFYSLVRKFVRESVALLRDQDWSSPLVNDFVSMLSSEVVSQLPNGLRMHLADLYLAEIHTAAGAQVTTEAFLLLLEPFFALLGGEYDKTVFKRVREVVFQPMLSEYTFGMQESKAELDETDEEQEEDEVKNFAQVQLERVQHRIFAIAAADGTAERNRAGLYALYSKFFAITKVDSLTAAPEEPAPMLETQNKESKKRKAKTQEEEVEKQEEKEPVAKKSKKQKKLEARKAEQEAAQKAEEEAKKAEKQAQKVAAAEKTKRDAEKAKRDAEKAKLDAEKAKEDAKKAKVEAKQAEKASQDAKKAMEPTVVTSGKKFRRCGACGGFGKNLVPKDKMLCRHCERTQKTQKKQKTAVSKKRKAQTQAQAQAAETEAQTESSKKVTFGKSKALKHDVSVKRLKASAKKESVAKPSDGIKGVLKVSSPPAAAKKSKKVKKTKARKSAADFF